MANTTIASAPSAFGVDPESQSQAQTQLPQSQSPVPPPSYSSRRWSTHWEWSKGCCVFDWAPSHTPCCRDFLKLIFCLFCSVLFLAGPIYMIAKSQTEVNDCKEQTDTDSYSCLLNGPVEEYAIWFSILFTLVLIDLYFVARVFGYTPRDLGRYQFSCIDCTCVISDALRRTLGQIVLLVLFCAFLWGSVFCGVLSEVESTSSRSFYDHKREIGYSVGCAFSILGLLLSLCGVTVVSFT